MSIISEKCQYISENPVYTLYINHKFDIYICNLPGKLQIKVYLHSFSIVLLNKQFKLGFPMNLDLIVDEIICYNPQLLPKVVRLRSDRQLRLQHRRLLTSISTKINDKNSSVEGFHILFVYLTG